MEPTPWDLVRQLASADPETAPLSDSEGQAFIDRLAERFVDDRQRKWWWEGLPGVVTRIPYGEEDGVALLDERFGNQRDVRLVVTDEESTPRGVVSGSASALLRLVSQAPFFEFAFADPELRWVAFDTHHNEVIIAGEPTSF